MGRESMERGGCNQFNERRGRESMERIGNHQCSVRRGMQRESMERQGPHQIRGRGGNRELGSIGAIPINHMNISSNKHDLIISRALTVKIRKNKK